jgi:RNA polymerase sigma factor (sigma-70 family)
MIESAAVEIVPLGIADRDALIVGHMHLAESLAGQCWTRIWKWRGHGLEREDVMQEARLGLVEAADTYNPVYGTQFSTWAIWNIRRALAAVTRRAGNSPGTADLGSDEQPCAGLVASSFVERADLRMDVRTALDSLPAEDRQLLEDVHVRFKTYGEIAAERGVCYKTVQRHVASAEIAFRHALSQ